MQSKSLSSALTAALMSLSLSAEEWAPRSGELAALLGPGLQPRQRRGTGSSHKQNRRKALKGRK